MDQRQRNKRAVLLLLVVFIGGAAYRFGVLPWVEHWRDIRAEIALREADLKFLGLLPDAEQEQKRERIEATVPAFAIPEIEEIQKNIFEQDMAEKLGGIGAGLPRYTGRTKKWSSLGVKQIALQYAGKTNFGRLMDTLVRLDESPYLVGIESFKMNCDPRKRQEVSVEMTVSTFVKQEEER